jgi:membrane-bound ClpP family serine protease
MSWLNWLCVALVIAGILCFLVGANIYNALLGWSGVYMFAGGIAIYLVSYVWSEIKKEQVSQKK